MCVILLPPVVGTSSGDRSTSEDRKTTVLARAGQHGCSDGRMYSSVTNSAIGAQMAQSDVAGEPAQRTPSGGTDTIGTVGAAPTTGRAAELLTRVSGNAQAGEVTPEAPFTGAPITTLPQASDADVREAFARARQQQSAWAAVPAAERQRVLQRLHDLILDRQQEALDLIQVEAGKARMDAFDEISS